MFEHIAPSQGEISSCLDAESAETLGISTGFLVFFCCFSSPPNLEMGSFFFFFLQLWPVVLMSSQMRSLIGDCQVP